MEAQRGNVACVEDALAVHLHTEGMGGIVNHLQAILVGNVLDRLGIAWLAIYMHWHDGGGARSDGSLNLVGVEVASGRVDVHENRLATVPPDTMGGSHEAIRCGDDLARDAQCLEGGEQRQGSVSEEAHVWHLEVGGEFLLQFSVVTAVVGNPLTVPNLLEFCREIVEIWQQRRCHGYDFLIHKSR